MVATIDKVFRDPSVYVSAAPETVALVTGAVPTSTGVGLLQLFAFSSSGSDGYVQVWDGYADPADGYTGQKLMVSYVIKSDTALQLDFTPSHWLPTKQGLVIVLSSTQATYSSVAGSKLFCTALWTTR